MDFLHIFRITGYKLRQEAELTPSDRRVVVRELEAILYALKNSVDKHLKDKDVGGLKKRINLTVDVLKALCGKGDEAGLF